VKKNYPILELTPLSTAMKFAIASIYTNFTDVIVGAEGMEQDDGFTAGPNGNKLILQYRRA
jgi:hypothetical protein